MKKGLLGLLACLFIVGMSCGMALGAEGPYLGVQVGATWLDDASNDYDDFAFSFDTEYDTGYNVGAAFGYAFDMARLEAEVAYRQNDIDKAEAGLSFDSDGDVSALSFLVNGYWDFKTPSSFTPYLGGGIGFAEVSINDFKVEGEKIADDDDTVFAYQLAAGVAYAINEAMSLDLGYRYFATSDPEFDDEENDSFESEYDSHNLSIGLRIMF